MDVHYKVPARILVLMDTIGHMSADRGNNTRKETGLRDLTLSPNRLFLEAGLI